MTRDCETLSEKAQRIFTTITGHFPKGPFERVNWEAAGRIYDNGWYDLRLSVDRQRLITKRQIFLGYLVEMTASLYKKSHGSLGGFTIERFSPQMQETAGLLLLLHDLDFQIETGDLVE